MLVIFLMVEQPIHNRPYFEPEIDTDNTNNLQDYKKAIYDQIKNLIDNTDKSAATLEFEIKKLSLTALSENKIRVTDLLAIFAQLKKEYMSRSYNYAYESISEMLTSIQKYILAIEQDEDARFDDEYNAPAIKQKAQQTINQQTNNNKNNAIYQQFANLIENNNSIASLYHRIAITDNMDRDDLTLIMRKLHTKYSKDPLVDEGIRELLNYIVADLKRAQKDKKDNLPVYDKASLADQLIAQAYVSPEMQYAVLSYVDDKPCTINAITGKIQNIPTIDRIILGKSNSKNDREVDPYADKAGRLNALHAALEAVNLAKFIAGLNVAYANPEYLAFAPKISSNYFMPPLDEQLIEALNKREQQLNEALGYDYNWGSWLWKWNWSSIIPTSLTNMFTIKNQPSHGVSNPLQVKPQLKDITSENNFVSIPDSTMKGIIKHYDYKQIIDSQQAAELLWKQCFIALQDFTQTDMLIYCFAKHGTISQTHYIYDNFTIDNHHVHTLDQICIHIKNAVHDNKHTPAAAHNLLLQLRKSVQTAMFIANKNSGYNIGYQLPTIVTQSLDKIVIKLNEFDKKLDALCQDASLGARTEDLARKQTWNKITAILTAGVVIAGAGTYAAVNYFTKPVTPTPPSKDSALASPAAAPDKSAVPAQDATNSVLNFLAGTVSTTK